MTIDLTKDNITDNIVFISGLTRSGKALLCPIVASLENSEKVNTNLFLEQIPFLDYLNKIEEDSAIYLLRSGMNLIVYDNAIGRNSNFRPDDFTSVWKYRNPMVYVKRLFLPDKDAAIEKIKREKTLFSMMVHNGLWHADIWFKALPKLKLIHVRRNPVEIVYSWMGKNYGGSFYSSTRSNIVTFNYKGLVLPYYAYGWEDEYINYNETDRIIYMIKKIREFHQQAYIKLHANLKSRILFVNHSDLETSPDSEMNRVLSFLKAKYSIDTPRIMLDERCPRIVNPNDLDIKLNEIKNSASTKAYSELIKMADEFNSNTIARENT